MSSREDIIEVPIEIRTSDIDELNRLIQELQEAKGKAETARAGKGKIPSTGSGAPIERGDTEPLSIFRASDNEAVPLKTRDTKSRQAVSRADPFHDLQKQVETLQNTNSQLLPFITGIGSTLGFSLPPFVSAGIGLGKNMKAKIQAVGKPVAVQTKLTGQASGKFVRLGMNMGKAIPFVGMAFVLIDFMANELPNIIREELYGAGKIMDRRFKRAINREYVSSVDYDAKAQTAQGYRSVITTTYAGARGASNVVNSKERALNGENIYNKSAEYMYGP